MRVKIMSRRAIEEYCAIPMMEKTAIISICDYGDESAFLLFKPDYLLQLAFDDVDSDVFADEMDTQYTDNDVLRIEKRYHMFSEEQAKRVAGFINDVHDKVDVFICQCEHGQSRSAAIAAAIREYMFSDGIDIFADDRYYPNKFIYRRVMSKLNEVDR